MKKTILLYFVFIFIFFLHIKSYAFTNGQDAYNCLGQFDTSTTPVPLYTKNGINDTLNNRGFYQPYRAAVDTVNHRLFVVDIGNHRVVVYNLDSSNNLIDYYADNVLGQPDFYSNTPACTQNRMNGPNSVTYDGTNNRLFVLSYGNHRVLVFDVTTITNGENAINVLGQSNFTSNSTACTQNGMYWPKRGAYDSTNNRLFVTDRGSHRILVFDVTTITNGENAINVLGQTDFITNTFGCTQSKMDSPRGIVYDGGNNRLFIGDRTNNRALIFDVTTINNGENAVNVLGQSDFISNTAACTQNGMSHPYGVEYDNANDYFFVADRDNHRILIFDVASISNGENAINVLGQTTFTTNTSTCTQSGLNYPNGVFYTGTNNRLFVSDRNNNRVVTFDLTTISNGENAVDCIGQFDISPTLVPIYTKNGINDTLNNRGFNTPYNTALDNSNHRLFMTDTLNNRILVYNLNTNNNLIDRFADNVLGQPDLYSNTAACTQNIMNNPKGIICDETNDRLFVADNLNNRVLIFDIATITNGENAINVLGQTNFTTNTSACTQSGMNTPHELKYDSTNNRLFVADNLNNRVLIFDVATISNGENAVNVLGQTNFTTNTSACTQSGMNTPCGVTYDGGNNRLFTGDRTNNRVLIFDVATITNGENAVNVLGQTNFTTNTSACTQSGMNNPYGLKCDSTNNRLFVADNLNHRLLIFDVTTISNGENAINVLGQSDFTSNTSACTQSGMNSPIGVIYNETKSLLFASDANNNRILIYSNDNVSPAAIINLAASTGTFPGEIDLSWTASGDNVNTGNISNGQYHIKYSSETAHTWDNMPYEIQWSTNTSPGNNENKTIGSLIEGTTYYFYIKIADEVPNWSGISNKPNASAQISSISISLDSSAYDFGTVLKNSTNVSVSSITVTNNGNVNERYSLHLAAPAGWTPVTDTAPGTEEFRMCGNFQTATAQSSHFDIGGSFSDAIGTTQRVCSSGDFSKDDEGETAKGYNVPPSEDRHLWFRFESPTSTTLTTQQTITVTVTAEQQP